MISNTDDARGKGASPSSPRWGLWLVGARGSVATTVMLGLWALREGATEPTGMVTTADAFRDVDLPSLDELVIGGSDVTDLPLTKRAEELEAARVVPAGLAARARPMLMDVADRLGQGVTADEVASSPWAAISRLRDDLAQFRRDHDLDHLVVVNVASTEPPTAPHAAHADLAALERALADGEPVLSPVGITAYAALTSKAAFVDFTPSSALTLPALLDLAVREGVPVAGRDGKTGETLVKTALAPMFADRALKIRSWSGMNLLGGGDGQTLADPQNAASKISSKASALASILGYAPEGPVRIDHVADLGDWKTAWDLITFEGFLGTRMQLQFTWEGCDSALAAPLILDLARLAVAADAAGISGPLRDLGYFFKDPIAPGPEGPMHRLDEQHRRLLAWARSLPR